MEQKELPKLPHGQGSFAYRNDKIEYKKTIELPNGKKVRKSVQGDSVKECMKKMDQLASEIVRTQKKEKAKSLIDAMNDWADNVKQRTLKEQSYDRLKSTIKNQIGTSPLAHERYQLVTTQEIDVYIQQLVEARYSHSVIKKTFDALRAFYNYICVLDKIDNPMQLATMPTVNNVKVESREIVFFDQEDIDKFTNEAHATWNTGSPRYRYGLIIAANIYLGMRIGELLALQWQDIDLEKNTIYISKTLIERRREIDGIPKTEFVVQNSTKKSKNRYVPINSKAKVLIEEYRQISEFTDPSDFVISTRNGKTATTKNIAEMIKAITTNAEMKVITSETHALRHTCASLYFRTGVPIETICQILGNTREVCEKTYVHFIEEQLKEAASKIDVIEI